jgi:hypothetical protein
MKNDSLSDWNSVRKLSRTSPVDCFTLQIELKYYYVNQFCHIPRLNLTSLIPCNLANLMQNFALLNMVVWISFSSKN